MAGLGRKTFSPGDVLTSSDVQGYLMDQSVMVFAGTAARASAIPSPSAGMVAYSTATSLQVYNGSAWIDASTGYGSASGGASSTAITVAGTAYTLLTFTSDGTLTVSKSGLFDVLMFGGGAGGGGGQSAAAYRGSGGGGAGAKVQSTVYLDANQTVTIGAGGGGGGDSTTGSRGLVTSIGGKLNIMGGGGGGGTGNIYNTVMRAQGCGGGGFGESGSDTGGLTLLPADNGFNGGNGVNNNAGGGGGGCAAVGAAGSGATGGAGGAGFDVNAFTGQGSLFKGGGGGGGAQTTGGAGGSSVGGAGTTGTGGTAAANTGSGGGGGRNTGSGGAGGSGIVYVRFKV